MNAKFIGPDEKLFCSLHQPTRRFKKPRAAVICPPIGHEYFRAHWSLRLLANQLARKGVFVLRFDYSGAGDSKGDISDIESVAQWHHDVDVAIDHLQSESNAKSVMLIGCRFGAAIASHIAKQNQAVNSLALWEPVLTGESMLNDWRQMHQKMLDEWVCNIKTPNNNEREELLGSVYQRAVIEEILQQDVAADQIEVPHLIFGSRELGEIDLQHEIPGLQKVCVGDDRSEWRDLSTLEVAWLGTKTLRDFTDLVDDMFNRLEKFGALNEPSPQMPYPTAPLTGSSIQELESS